MSYVVLDLETSGDEYDQYNHFCNPFNEKHRITLLGYKFPHLPADVMTAEGEFNGCENPRLTYKDDLRCTSVFSNIFEKNPSDYFGPFKYLIGQNIKFDLSWFWGSESLQTWIADGGKIWDTQLVQYLIDAQQKTPRNLNALSTQYGGTLKDDFIEQELKTKWFYEIEKSRAIEYCKADVVNTEIVAKAQTPIVKQMGLENIVRVYNRHLLAVTEMEYNGVYIDLEVLKENRLKLDKNITDTIWRILSVVNTTDWPPHIDFNVASNGHIHFLLFGGTLKNKEKGPVKTASGQFEMFKNGKIKEKIQEKPYFVAGLKLRGGHLERNANGLCKVNKEALETLLNTKHREVIEDILLYRTLTKLRSTYYDGFETARHPDGCVHTSYKLAYTATGRLSSSEPNVQNVPAREHSEVLQMFTSRFGPNGTILEFDYSQLEVVLLTWLSGCPQMLKDRHNKVDIHLVNCAFSEGITYEEAVRHYNNHDAGWDQLRSQVGKGITFGKQYGAGPTKIAQTANLDVEIVKRVLAADRLNYPRLYEFYEIQAQTVQANAARGVSIIPSITGKRYAYTEIVELDSQGKARKYWPSTDIKNYPVQGLAADLVAMMVGKLFLVLQPHRDKCLLVNEVHDSVIIDCKKEHVDFIKELVYTTLMTVKGEFKREFGLEFDVPLEVDCKVGTSWYECKHGED